MMPKIERFKTRHLLRKREQKEELERIEKHLRAKITGLSPDIQFEEGITDDGSRVLLLNGTIVFFESEGKLFPTLRALLDGIISIPRVVVDMGAVKYVTNGADIMRPGIRSVDDGIAQGSVVVVVDERHGKPLAVGVSTMNTEGLRAASSGKVVISKHHVGDDLWEFGKSVE
ncbi:MAG: RNA-binding protein [Candidatus Thorarchaeota archaeon]|nr:MAG: RNA-binding protein [Candidatus Thorarchaeota archaeon]